MTLDLGSVSQEFADDVQDTLDRVLLPPHGVAQDDRQLKLLRSGAMYVVRSGRADQLGGIGLYAGGSLAGRLEIQYHCTVDSSGGFLAVRKSKFQLTSAQENKTPLLRLDYMHDAHTTPKAHWNIHAERGATSVMLARCNPKHEGLLSQVHFPVGGPRYRPCLEDFLEMLIIEFNFDCQPAWRDVIQSKRESWRIKQIRAVVRDAPEEAASVLERLGYQLTRPATGAPEGKPEMLRCR